MNSLSASNVCMMANKSLISESKLLRKKCIEFMLDRRETPLCDVDLLMPEIKNELLKETFCHVSTF